MSITKFQIYIRKKSNCDGNLLILVHMVTLTFLYQPHFYCVMQLQWCWPLRLVYWYLRLHQDLIVIALHLLISNSVVIHFLSVVFRLGSMHLDFLNDQFLHLPFVALTLLGLAAPTYLLCKEVNFINLNLNVSGVIDFILVAPIKHTLLFEFCLLGCPTFTLALIGPCT